MVELKKETNEAFKEFYTGKNGRKTVNCILDDNCVRYVVFEGLRVKSKKEFGNNQKELCFNNATKILNKVSR